MHATRAKNIVKKAGWKMIPTAKGWVWKFESPDGKFFLTAKYEDIKKMSEYEFTRFLDNIRKGVDRPDDIRGQLTPFQLRECRESVNKWMDAVKHLYGVDFDPIKIDGSYEGDDLRKEAAKPDWYSRTIFISNRSKMDWNHFRVTALPSALFHILAEDLNDGIVYKYGKKWKEMMEYFGLSTDKKQIEKLDWTNKSPYLWVCRHCGCTFALSKISHNKEIRTRQNAIKGGNIYGRYGCHRKSCRKLQLRQVVRRGALIYRGMGKVESLGRTEVRKDGKVYLGGHVVVKKGNEFVLLSKLKRV